MALLALPARRDGRVRAGAAITDPLRARRACGHLRTDEFDGAALDAPLGRAPAGGRRAGCRRRQAQPPDPHRRLHHQHARPPRTSSSRTPRRAAGPPRRGSARPRSTSTASRPASCCGRARAHRTPTTRSARSSRSRPTPASAGFEAIWTDAGGLAVPIAEQRRRHRDAARPTSRSGCATTAGRSTAEYSVATARRWTADRPARALRRRAARRGARDRRRHRRHRRQRRLRALRRSPADPRSRSTASDQDGTAPLNVNFSSTVERAGERARLELRRRRHRRRRRHAEPHVHRSRARIASRSRRRTSTANTTVGSTRVVVRPSARRPAARRRVHRQRARPEVGDRCGRG